MTEQQTPYITQPASDDELIACAIGNLLQALTPRQVMHLSRLILDLHGRGYGELHLVWFNGHLDRVLDITSYKVSQMND